SSEPMVWRDTSSALASSSCLMARALRSSSRRFFMKRPLSAALMESLLSVSSLYHRRRLMSSILSIFPQKKGRAPWFSRASPLFRSLFCVVGDLFPPLPLVLQLGVEVGVHPFQPGQHPLDLLAGVPHLGLG